VKETEEKTDVELKELQATLANIERSRSFEQLTVGTLVLFRDHEIVETMLKKGKWTDIPSFVAGCTLSTSSVRSIFLFAVTNISFSIIIHRLYSNIQVTKRLAIDIHLGFTLTNPTWRRVLRHCLR